MKKLLSVFAAASVLFGFASCSGDLHDDSIKPLYIEGAMSTTRTAITMIDDTTQEYEFTYESGMSKEWGSPAAGVAFKFIKSAAAWTDDFGGKQDEPVYLNINDDFVTLEARSGSNSNPGNVVIDNLTPGETYKLIVDYDAANKIVKVKVTGAAIDFPNLELIDEAGTKYPLTRSGSTYSYVWTPAEAGSKSFYVTNGYMFYGADGEVKTEKPDAEDYVTVSYEANKEYIVKVETTYDKGADVTIETGRNDKSILSAAEIIGGFDGWKGSKLTYVDETTQIFEFTNSGVDVEFAIREKAGDWTVGRWFKGIPEDTAERKKTDIADDIVAAKYGETPKPVVLTYYKGDAGNDGKNAKIIGMPIGTGYKFKLTIKIIDPKTKKVSVSCEAIEDIPAGEYDPANFDSYYKLNSLVSLNSSYGDYPITWGEKQSDGSYIGTVTIPSGSANGWKGTAVEFGVASDTSWTNKHVGAVLASADTYVKLTKGEGANNKITATGVGGATLTSNVVITLKSTENDISVKFTTN